MVLGADKFRICSSDNLRQWRLESVENFVTECPDLFELPVDGGAPEQTKWVLSLAGISYRLGNFDGKRFVAETGDLPFSYRSCLYAGQTFSDVPDGRHILIQWNNRYDQEKLGTAWGSALSLPAELSLRKDGDAVYLIQQPVRELKTLRVSTRQWEDISFNGSYGAFDKVRALLCEMKIVMESRSGKLPVLLCGLV